MTPESPVDRPGATKPPETAANESTPSEVGASFEVVTAVFDRIAAWYGKAHRVPQTSGRADHASSLEECAAAWGFRTREIRLEADWWNQDLGPLIGYRDGGEPVALLPHGRGYRMFCPTRAETVRVTRDHAEELRHEATIPYRVLDAEAPSLPELARFSSGGGGRDLRLAVSSGVVTAVVASLVPVLAGLVTTLVPDDRGARLIDLGFGVLAAGTLAVVAAFARGLAVSRLEGRAGVAVQAAMWGRLLAASNTALSRWSTSRISKVILGADALRERLVWGGVTAFVTALCGLCQLALLLVIDVEIGIAALMALSVSGVVFWALARSQHAAEEVAFARDQRLSALTTRLIGGVVKLRTAHAEERAFGNWRDVFASRETGSLRARRASDMTSGVPVLSYATCVFGALAAGAVELPRDEPSPLRLACVVALIALAHFARECTAAMANVVSVLPQLTEAVGMLSIPTDPVPSGRGLDVLRGGVSLEDVSFRYDARSEVVLDRVRLHVTPGEFVVVSGPSGSGKSTLLRLILGMERPETGVVAHDGHDLATLDAGVVRAQCGVVLQDDSLFAGDVGANIIGDRDRTVEQAWDAAARVGLDAEISAMPMGMRTPLAEGARVLSEGQRQRLVLARALLDEPGVLVLDEAMSALDAESRQRVESALRQQCGTRIVVTRELSTLRCADRIVVLDGGKIVQQGSYDELAHEPRGAFAELIRR